MLLPLFFEHGVAPEIILQRNCRRAHHHLALFLDAADDSGLGSDRGVVRDCDVTDNANLTCYDAVAADLGGTRDSCHGSHHGVVTDDHIVGNLAEVVDLDPVAYDGRFHLGLVDGGPGSDLDIVTDDDVADVLDLLPCTVRKRSIAESVRTDDGIGMDYHIVAYNHPRIDHHTGVDDAVVADHGVVTDIDILVDFRVIADFGMMSDIRMASKLDFLAELGSQEPG